jgi:hypothetical protein
MYYTHFQLTGKDLATRGTAMSVDLQILLNGHVDPCILTDYAEHPDDFDDDVVEEIWHHLDDCESCVEDYEAIRDGRLKGHKSEATDPAPDDSDESDAPETPPAIEDVLESDTFDPDDLANAKLDKKDDGGGHINGLMPVGDDPTRNGRPVEHENDDDAPKPEEDENEEGVEGEDREAEVAAEEESEEEEEDKEDEDDKIEGLITGEVTKVEKPADQLETESAVEAGERLAREKAQEEDEEVAVSEEPAPDEISASEEPAIEETAAAEEEPDDDPFIDPAQPADRPEPRQTRPRITLPPSADATPAKPKLDQAGPAKPAPAPPAPAETEPPKPAPAPHPVAATKSEPLEDFFKKVFSAIARPRSAIIFGSVVLLAAAAVIYMLVFSGDKEISPVAGWEPLNVIETRVPLQEVIIRKMRNGRIARARGTDVTLDFRGIGKLVIAVDLDFIKGNQSPYEVIVRDPAGTNVFQEQIPQLYLDDGRFFLRLIPDQFEPDQTYKLELVSHRADGSMRVIAESVFDVLK